MEGVLQCKRKLCQQLWRTGKVAFCVFWFTYALRHREYSPFSMISVQAPHIEQDGL